MPSSQASLQLSSCKQRTDEDIHAYASAVKSLANLAFQVQSETAKRLGVETFAAGLQNRSPSALLTVKVSIPFTMRKSNFSGVVSKYVGRIVKAARDQYRNPTTHRSYRSSSRRGNTSSHISTISKPLDFHLDNGVISLDGRSLPRTNRSSDSSPLLGAYLCS